MSLKNIKTEDLLQELNTRGDALAEERKTLMQRLAEIDLALDTLDSLNGASKPKRSQSRRRRRSAPLVWTKPKKRVRLRRTPGSVQRAVLEAVKADPREGSKVLREVRRKLPGVRSDNIYRALKRLVDAGKVTRTGESRNFLYALEA